MHDAITGRASTGGDRVTNGEKKSILLEYRAIERRINRLIDEKAAWNAKATATTSSFSDMPRSGGGSDKIQTTVEKIIEIEEKLDHEIDALVDLRNRIEAAVERLESEKLRDIMRYKYIDGLKFEEIAVTMHLDRRWVRRLHNRALNILTLESPPTSML